MALTAYLSLYTWNARTGVLDSVASKTGLEFVGWVIKPGRFVVDQTMTTWNRYVYLVGLRQENDTLRKQIDDLTIRLASRAEEAAEARRLAKLMEFETPDKWESSGARVIAQRLGPNAVLDTFVVGKGTMDSVSINTPVATANGLVGRVLRTGLTSSQVLLLSDQNSKIPVLGRDHRTTGILTGRDDELLEVRYVPLNAPLDEGELLVTSGLAEIYPKGIPVARVVSIERSDISLFLDVRAEPLVNLRDLEEILLLARTPQVQPQAATNATAVDSPAAGGQ